MRASRRLIVIGAVAATLLLASVGVAVALIVTSHPAGFDRSASGRYPGGYGMMGNGGYGMGNGGGYGMGNGGGYGMMGDGGYGPGGAPGAPARPPQGRITPRGAQAVTVNVRSDAEHGRRGSDGRWHDAFLPADFSVHAGYAVTVTVDNYDDMPHSFTSPPLGVSETVRAGSAARPARTTFTFIAPSHAGRYEWWCALPCDPWAMAHDGYMRGYVTVTE